LIFDINQPVRFNSLICIYSKEESEGFSHELTEQLMELQKSLPCLWQVKSEDYFNKQLKILPTTICSKTLQR
jgi:hypothetical protein